jgi:hypothetical protein
LKDVVRGFGPFEGLGITIVSFDEGSDIGFERGDATVDAARKNPSLTRMPAGLESRLTQLPNFSPRQDPCAKHYSTWQAACPP